MASSNWLLVRQVMQSTTVRNALAAKARTGKNIADGLAASQGHSARATVSAGTRPLGRPYARVSMPGDTEWGDYKTPRFRLMAQVAAQLRNR